MNHAAALNAELCLGEIDAADAALNPRRLRPLGATDEFKRRF